MVDLHCHSTASDGTWSPGQLVAAAAELGLTALALTDHDTVAGVPEFLAAAAVCPALTAISGVELTCHWQGQTHHLLGLAINPDDDVLRQLLRTIRFQREQRLHLVLKQLAHLGYPITPAEVAAVAPGGLVCRTHLARLLVERGACPTPQDAFARYLGRGRPAYVSMTLPALPQAIAAIHHAGGRAIWAHPTGLNHRPEGRLRRLAQQFRAAGLDGLEAWYPHYTPAQQEGALRIARQLGLLVTGGSDFHGDHSPGIRLGVGRGDLAIPDSVLAALLAR
jgi:predicted metal-dependent phosphoesterase TrpH